MKTMLMAAAALLVLAAAGRADGAAAKKDEAKPAAEQKDAVPAKKEAAAADKKEGAKPEAPEFIMFEKTKAMAPVKFPHKLHAEKAGGCAACHEGKEPIFKQEKPGEGLKMADIYAGKACGACHDGKKLVGGKTVFAAKTGCMKCHKKAEPAKK